MERWAFIHDGPTDPVLNMALDDALLEGMGLGLGAAGMPVLRWYGWRSPAATFGYFQARSEVEGWTRLRPLLRRPTGGGLVPHLEDWTYALAVPAVHPWHGLRAVESYERMHQWIARALRALGVPATLAACCETSGPGRCFEGWEKFDVLSAGRKVAGAAQRRTRGCLLIQGSIQPLPRGVAREAFEAAMRDDATREWGLAWDMAPDPASQDRWRSRARELVEERHGLESYQGRR